MVFYRWVWEPDAEAADWSPTVDVYETGDAIVVRAELPGMEKEQVGVEFREGVLTLCGERKPDREVGEESYHRMERAYGSFRRSFAIPASVEEEKISARMKDGVLEVRLPKKEESKPKRITIAA